MKKDKYLIKTLFVVFAFLLILNFCCSCRYGDKDSNSKEDTKYPQGVITEIQKDHYLCSCKIKFLKTNLRPYSESLLFKFNCDSVKVGDTVDLNIRK